MLPLFQYKSVHWFWYSPIAKKGQASLQFCTYRFSSMKSNAAVFASSIESLLVQLHTMYRKCSLYLIGFLLPYITVSPYFRMHFISLFPSAPISMKWIFLCLPSLYNIHVIHKSQPVFPVIGLDKMYGPDHRRTGAFTPIKMNQT